MHVYIAAYSHKYPYIHCICAQEVCKTPSQCIHTQEAGEHYTRLTQLQCSATNFHTEGYSASSATLPHGETDE